MIAFLIPCLSLAAVSAINKTKFNPGENGGKKVKVKFALNLVFKLK